MKEFLEYAESHAEEILSTLRHMVEMESFTADKASTDVLGGYIKERLEELGAQVRLVPQEEVGDHLEVWPESHWPGFALRQSDVLPSYTAQ